MVEVIVKQDQVIFEILGVHKILALRSRFIIPRDHIESVTWDKTSLWQWKGWRIPGTFFPGVIRAGTYYHKGSRIFWDVADADKALLIQLRDESYDKLIIEVNDPEAVMEQLGLDG